jgi:hypothetical protein
MATITGVTTPQEGGTFHTIWETLTETNDVGSGIKIPGAADRSVQVMGTVGGATVIIEGSNVLTPTVDGDWFTLHDENGDVLTFTVLDDGHAIAENTLRVRPRITGGTAVDIDVLILSRSTP